MNTSFKIAKKIEDLFLNNDILWATEISKILEISRTIVHISLKDLLKAKKVKKIGKWAHVKYKSLIFDKNNSVEMFLWNMWNKEIIINNYNPNFKVKKNLEELFYKFSPEWKILTWFNGIKTWCETRDMNLEEKINNFLKINEHIENIQNSCGLISAKEAFWKHFENIYLDEIFYADQYNWMEFWRGKLAEMTFYAKQSQNIKLINEANSLIILKLECIIKQWNFDAIAITPWSISRKNQLLWLLKDKLKELNLPFVNIIKYYENNIPIPQKSLKTREQRIQNATNTIFVEDKNISNYKKVFLIDDFVGSGSTLNITAKKLKESWIKEIIWFSYVWNLNLSYEVINEV